MSKPKIGGILQVGIGVTDMPQARSWYHKNLHFSAQVLEEKTIAGLMKAYTGGMAHERQAAIVMNMSGAGGLEVWQYLSREPKLPKKPIQLGDLGTFCIKLKTPDIHRAHKILKHLSPSAIEEGISGKLSFTFSDPYRNFFQVIEGVGYFEKPKTTSGVYGAIVGCSDLEKSIAFYTDVLGYELQRAIESDIPKELSSLPGAEGRFNRAWLTKPVAEIGGFSKFLGNTEIELIQSLDRTGIKIYEDRYWGDPGFIHICFDVRDMDALKAHCKLKGFPFVLDSFETEEGESFNMGEVTSRVAYIDDPDGTAIEFVETHKVPVIPSLGLSINLQGNDSNKDVPTWLLKLIKIKKVKNG
ncbi:VOC family protein [Marinoscillum sp. MHG1-6]|uniref:VOC family protein n=1 Tax=Marinoscillum sp. MHG1-6 TaxID=2959627 RepID=UPI002157790B|nr:VOC family protein [Marinoscillum sp. MHG1-6]